MEKQASSLGIRSVKTAKVLNKRTEQLTETRAQGALKQVRFLPGFPGRGLAGPGKREAGPVAATTKQAPGSYPGEPDLVRRRSLAGAELGYATR